MTHENKFWESINSQLSTGAAPLIANERGHQEGVFVYAVDTYRGWVGAGSTSAALFATARKRRDEARESKGIPNEAFLDAANQLISTAGRMFVGEPTVKSQTEIDQYPELVLDATSCAIASTKTYDCVSAQTGGLAGHWFYIVYHTRFQGTIGRAFFKTSQYPGFLLPQDLLSSVKRVIAIDTSGPTSMVKTMLKDSGGVVLNPNFKV